ncbi:MAG: aldo/keto reductase [Oscillospiraceae bacterium]|jgi:diketogulonate reductase-like aldo/keto reductase|nr:aldo/keto reductase [Oscillospiraceae bacterium]
MRQIDLRGLSIPCLGQGGWELGDDTAKSTGESASLLRGLELGITLIDTAEMYGGGNSEELIGRALHRAPRGSYQLCSKVLPQNAGRERIFAHCEESLRRLGTDYLDIYLLHWRGEIPLAETVACMEELVRQGKILRWGVSNFDVSDMEELFAVPGGEGCAVNQVLYHIGSRGIEFDLLPWCRTHNVAVMAYCPLAQGGKLRRYGKNVLVEPLLIELAEKYSCTAQQILLAFVLRQDGVIAIPKSANPHHTEQNARAAELLISGDDWARVDRVFRPPTEKMHLDIE